MLHSKQNLIEELDSRGTNVDNRNDFLRDVSLFKIIICRNLDLG